MHVHVHVHEDEDVHEDEHEHEHVHEDEDGDVHVNGAWEGRAIINGVRAALVTAFGLVSSLAYGAAIVWLYVTQPRTLREVRSGAQVVAGVYQVDEARFQAGLEMFRREQYAAARDEWQRADPARRDARVAFYAAYSFYREGWGRLHHDDTLYAQGLEAVDRAQALAGGQPLRVDDPELGIHTPAELRAELQNGVQRTWSDLNPLRVLDKRK